MSVVVCSVGQSTLNICVCLASKQTQCLTSTRPTRQLQPPHTLPVTKYSSSQQNISSGNIFTWSGTISLIFHSNLHWQRERQLTPVWTKQHPSNAPQVSTPPPPTHNSPIALERGPGMQGEAQHGCRQHLCVVNNHAARFFVFQAFFDGNEVEYVFLLY